MVNNQQPICWISVTIRKKSCISEAVLRSCYVSIPSSPCWHPHHLWLPCWPLQIWKSVDEVHYIRWLQHQPIDWGFERKGSCLDALRKRVCTTSSPYGRVDMRRKESVKRWTFWDTPESDSVLETHHQQLCSFTKQKSSISVHLRCPPRSWCFSITWQEKKWICQSFSRTLCIALEVD